jgi:hypothetical protein
VHYLKVYFCAIFVEQKKERKKETTKERNRERKKENVKRVTNQLKMHYLQSTNSKCKVICPIVSYFE